ncbi:uncharacterized protein RHO25_013150 [Cercospora beticola]|uniref:Pisatin demethylase n=1 Tax=Cercospora beticola TaxID=122368 RepID=A0ABZ0P985_CERBT|nr:hypothetical protein RHO25_013150 [Cercospora beticola]
MQWLDSTVSQQFAQRAAGGVVLLLLLHFLYNAFFHPLRNVPGPVAARFSSLWLNRRYFRGSWLQDVVRLHEKYGPVVRIAPNEISFVDEGALKELYGHGKPSQKTSWYDTWVIPGMGDSFFATTNRHVHRRIRSRVSGTYSMSAILSMEELIGEVMELNIAKLRELATKDEPVRIDEYANYFTFDVVGQLSMGGPIGFLEQGKDVGGNIQSIHDGFYLMANMGHVPGKMFWFNNPVARFLIRKFGGERMNTFETFLGWLEKRVDQRMQEGLGDRRFDMLQYFINGKTQDGKPVSKGEVMIEGVNILGAGADTTAIAILAVLGQLLLRDDALQRVRAEVDQAYATNGASFRELEKLPFLSAVVRESMRLHPSITYQLPRVPPAGGMRIGQYHIPGTASCGISPAAMNRSHDLFGSDADKFVPERWLPADDSPEEAKRLRVMEQNLTTFGMGSRSCVGRNLALVETYKYIATFVRHFDAELVNAEQPWITRSQWFSFPKDFWIHLHLRKAVF